MGIPKISVIIVAYNRKKYLKEAIDSVLANEYDKNRLEIIVIKNFSDEVLDSYIESNGIISLISDDVNVGEQLANGINKSKGDIICFLDDDDRFRSDKLKTVESKFTYDSSLVYYHNQSRSIDVNSVAFIGNAHEHIDKSTKIQNSSLSQLWAILRSSKGITLYSLIFNLSSVSIKRRAIIKYINFLSRIIDGTDWFFFCCALMERSTIEFDSLVLTDYRVHNSTSNSIDKNTSIRDFAIFLTDKLTNPNHGTIVSMEMSLGTEFYNFIWAKFFEEKIMIKSIGQSSRIHLRFVEYMRYLCYEYTIMHSTFWKFLYIISSILFPRQIGIFYVLYRKRNLKKLLSI